MFRAYRDLEVWKKSMQLVTLLYKVTDAFPKAEQYGLTSQIRRSAVSVPSNIAEGKCRVSQKEFLRHLDIAYASLAELETQLEIAVNLEYLATAQFKSLLENSSEIGRMLNGLMSSVSQKPATRSLLPATLEEAV